MAGAASVWRACVRRRLARGCFCVECLALSVLSPVTKGRVQRFQCGFQHFRLGDLPRYFILPPLPELCILDFREVCLFLIFQSLNKACLSLI